MDLNMLLDLICTRTNLHVCIHDISGILRNSRLRIDVKYHTHTKPICNIAKSSPLGFDTCIACKDASNRRAASGECFSRACPFGIYEIIRPVMIRDKVRCIVYLGNISEDIGVTSKMAEIMCGSVGLHFVDMQKELCRLEQVNGMCTAEYYGKLADFICGFIKELYDEDETSSSVTYDGTKHWCVEKAEQYIKQNYEKNMTLSSVAGLYFINEKYLGRIFKKQTGKTFHEYLNDVRLEKSRELLSGSYSIISVSHMCGFVNVTYFNRCFKIKYGISPGEYRRGIKKTADNMPTAAKIY